jgi:hypothetical protein
MMAMIRRPPGLVVAIAAVFVGLGERCNAVIFRLTAFVKTVDPKLLAFLQRTAVGAEPAGRAAVGVELGLL